MRPPAATTAATTAPATVASDSEDEMNSMNGDANDDAMSITSAATPTSEAIEMSRPAHLAPHNSANEGATLNLEDLHALVIPFAPFPSPANSASPQVSFQTTTSMPWMSNFVLPTEMNSAATGPIGGGTVFIAPVLHNLELSSTTLQRVRELIWDTVRQLEQSSAGLCATSRPPISNSPTCQEVQRICVQNRDRNLAELNHWLRLEARLAATLENGGS